MWQISQGLWVGVFMEFGNSMLEVKGESNTCFFVRGRGGPVSRGSDQSLHGPKIMANMAADFP